MLDARSKQPSFFDTDQTCQPLFPPDSFWHRFRELICPLINDEDYACLYCPDRGRPAKSPALLTMVTILQQRENLSDREAEDRVRYDLRWKYALALEVNDEGFDHTLLGKFRDRLLRDGKERASFELVLEKLVEEQVLKPEEVQITDATQVVDEQHPLGLKPAKLLADSKYSSVPNITGLVEMGTTLVAPLKKRPRRYGTFGADEFTYLPEQDRLRCPAGRLSRFKSRHPYGPRFRFAEEDCRACSLQERCLSGSEAQPSRSVILHRHHRAIQRLRDYMKTELFTEEMKRRRGIEPKIAELVRFHGMRRARYRGLAKVNFQCLFTALVVNIKRWFNLIQARVPTLAPA